MRFKLLGRSGLKVSELCLGAMTFGEEWGWGASKEESRKIFDAFVKAGGNFIDTANVYTNGSSEKYLAEFIGDERERFVLATKYVSNMRRGDPNAGGSHRKNLVQSLEASLKRLNTDYIDLYWVHAWDFTTPVEEVMRALDDMVRAGKILYVGVSDAPAWIVSQANTLASIRGWTPFTGLQVEYSLIQRTPERDLLPMASAFDVGVTAWSPLGGGVLTGKYGKNEPPKEATRYTQSSTARWAERILSERNLTIAQEVQKIATEIGCAPSQVALNWVRQQEGVIIPIIGSRKLSQVTENLGSLDFELTQPHLERLDKVSRIELGFPHEFLAFEEIKEIMYGGTFPLIDTHKNL